MYQIDRLDFNIAYACNLACKGCISLSDFDRKGVEAYDSLKHQIDTWSKILSPAVITLFGGEPLLHPRLHDIIIYVRSSWPDAVIRLITNGYLLRKQDPKKWFDYKPFEIQVSIHRKDHEKLLTNEIKKILLASKNWKVRRNNGKGHRDMIFSIEGFSVWKSRFKDFVVPFNKKEGKIVPFTSDPKKSHKICGAPNTPVLYKNKLYKCPPIANILDIPDAEGFEYTPVSSRDNNLKQFVDNIGKPESICSMCPENIENKIDHFDKDNVYVKDID